MFFQCTQKFKSAADDKAGLAPDSIVEMFMEVTQKCTQKNYKRRCSIQQVNYIIVVVVMYVQHSIIIVF